MDSRQFKPPVSPLLLHFSRFRSGCPVSLHLGRLSDLCELKWLGVESGFGKRDLEVVKVIKRLVM